MSCPSQGLHHPIYGSFRANGAERKHGDIRDRERWLVNEIYIYIYIYIFFILTGGVHSFQKEKESIDLCVHISYPWPTQVIQLGKNCPSQNEYILWVNHRHICADGLLSRAGVARSMMSQMLQTVPLVACCF